MVYPEGTRAIPIDSLWLSHTSRSGKTSLIHSLAGELGLDIYVVSLSSKGYVILLTDSWLVEGADTTLCRMSDNTLASLMGNVPSRYVIPIHARLILILKRFVPDVFYFWKI